MSNYNIKNIEKTINELTEGSDTGFHNWFDPTSSVDETLIRGYWDFCFNILKNEVCSHIHNPHEKQVLEIGYGGGRLLNAACRFFNTGIGIDIHNESSKVADLLRKQGHENFKLIKTDGQTIDFESDSVDLVYSFIVLCHMDSIEKIISYLNESFRVIKNGGIAQLFYLSFRYNRRLGFKNFLKGYHVSFSENESQWTGLPNCRIHEYYISKLAKKAGFKILEVGNAYKKAPDGYPNKLGMQRYLTLLKP